MKGMIYASLIITVSIILVAGGGWAGSPSGEGGIPARVEKLEVRVATLETAVTGLLAANARQQRIINDLSTRLTDAEEALDNARSVLALARFISVNEDPIDGMVGPHLIFEGVNVHIRSGSGSTNDNIDDGGDLTGLGNLVVGYNEERGSGNARGGSHNIILGDYQNFSSFGGLVAGRQNTISGEYASVTAGHSNTASGYAAHVSGGWANKASFHYCSVSGGSLNEANGWYASVSGGYDNTASGYFASVSGGSTSTASGERSSVSGGYGSVARGHDSSVSGGWNNTASEDRSCVSGGEGNVAAGYYSSVSGGYFNTASGQYSSVSGGKYNEASGESTSISGGNGVTISGLDEWAASSLVDAITGLTIDKPGLVNISGIQLRLKGTSIILNDGARPAAGVGDQVIVLDGIGTISQGSTSVFLP